MAGGSEVGSGHVSIFPVMTGFKAAVSKEMQAVGHEGSGIFGKSFNGVGSKTGSSLGRDMKSAFTGASKDMATPGLKKLESEVASAARAMSAARLKQQDAAGKVRVAEAQYAEAVKKSGEGSVQAVSASERLASAKRKEESTSETLTAAEKRLKDAKKAVADVKQATIEAPKVGPFESAVTRIRSAIQGLNAQRLDKAGATVTSLGTAYQGVVGHVKASTVAIGSLLASGVRGIVNYGRTAIDAYNEISGTTAKFQQIASNNHWAQDQTQALLAYNKELGRTGIISAGTLKASQAQLGTFMLSSQSVKTLTPALADLIANVKGYDATAEDGVQLSNLLGKVMTGNVGALSRYGVTLDANQKKLLAHGSQEERAAVLAKVLEQNFGGVNKAMAATPYGKYVIMQHQLAAIKTTIGSGFIDAIGALGDMGINVVDKVNGKLDSFFQWLPNAVGGIVSLLRNGKVTDAFAQAFHVPDSARQGIENTVNHVRDSVKGLGDFLKSGTISKSFNEGFKGMDPKVVERFQEALKRVREQITGTTKELHPFSGGMKDAKPGLDLATKGVETVTLALNTLSPTITIMEKLVKVFSSLPAPVQGAIGASLLFGKQIRAIEAPIGLALKAVEGLGKGIKAVGSAVGGFLSQKIFDSTSVMRASQSLDGVGTSAKGAASEVAKAEKSTTSSLSGIGLKSAGIGAVTTGVLILLGQHFQVAAQNAQTFSDSMQKGAGAVEQYWRNVSHGGSDYQLSWIDKLTTFGKDKTLSDTLKRTGTDMQTFRSAVEGSGSAMEQVTQKHNGLLNSLDLLGLGWIKEVTGINTQHTAVDKLRDSYLKGIDAMTEYATAQEGISNGFGKASSKISDLSTTLKANGDDLHNNGQLSKESSEYLQSAGNAALEAAKAQVIYGKANGDAAGGVQTAKNQIQQMRDSLVGQLQQFGMSKEAAEQYANKLGLIPANVNTNTFINTQVSMNDLNAYLDRMGATPEQKKTVMNAITKEASGNIDNLHLKIDDLPKWVQSILKADNTDAVNKTDTAHSKLNSYNGSRGNAALTVTDHASGPLDNVLDKLKNITSHAWNTVINLFTGQKRATGGPVGRANGGPVGLASGGGPYGLVRGPGTTTSDSIPVMLSDQEYVIKARSARSIGLAALDRMNRTGRVEPSTPTVVSPTVIQPVTITNNGVKDPYVEGTILGRQMASSARMTLRRMA